MSQYSLNKSAAALRYRAKDSAPIVIAAGQGYLAQKIIETAVENEISIYEDDTLATMLSQLDLGTEIPHDIYQSIVDIYIYFLDFKPDKDIE